MRDSAMLKNSLSHKNDSSLNSCSIQSSDEWKAASYFVDSLHSAQSSRFDSMTDAEMKMDRLRSKC